MSKSAKSKFSLIVEQRFKTRVSRPTTTVDDLHFDKFPTPATFASWKMRFKTDVCTCSQFPTEAMQWIKEVELVDSVDELRTSSSIRGISMPNFEVLDARIASALNKSIHNSHFKGRISLEEQKAQKEDRFLRGRQIAYLIYDQFPGHWNPWFCRKLHRLVHFCSSKWRYSGIRFLVGRNFIVIDKDSTWRHVGRIVQIKNTKVGETQDRIAIVRLGDSSEEVRTWVSMVKRSIEQDVRNKNFWSRNGNFEKNAVVKNQGTKQRVQRILGDRWQLETNGQCVNGNNCSFRHDINKRGRSYTIKSVCEFFHAAEWAKIIEDPKSQR